jgi:uncharacterized hydrophobic protein (TIGR00271 family)
MSEETGTTTRGSVRFSRILQPTYVVALGATATVGLAVFDLMGPLLQLSSGRSALIPYLGLLVLAIPIVLTYAERAAVVPGVGGAYNLGRISGSLGITFTSGWLLLGGYIMLMALLGHGMAVHIDLIAAELFEVTIPTNWLAALVIGVAAAAQLVGSRFNWRTRSFFVFAAIVIIALLILRAILFPADDEIGQITVFGVTPLSYNQMLVLLAASLWGIFFILNARDQIQRPTKTILPSMAIAVAVACLLGGLAVIALERIPSSMLTTVAPLATLSAGLGIVPDDVIVIFYGLLGAAINLLALNRCMVYGLGLIEAMTRDGFVSDRLQRITTYRGVPAVVLAIFVLAGIATAVLAKLDVIVGLVSLSFLWVTALVHLPDLLRSHPNLPEKRKPKLPFHPLFPGLTVAIGLLLPLISLQTNWVVVVIWLAIGGILFLGYGRQHAGELRRAESVVDEGAPDAIIDRSGYRVMVGIANPESARNLIEAGAQLARSREGSLLVLKTLTLPEQMPVNLRKEQARKERETLQSFVDSAEIVDVAIHTSVRLAPNPTDGLLAAVKEEQVDMLLLGWESGLAPEKIGPHSLLNQVMRYAPCEVAVLRGHLPERLDSVLASTAGGPNAPAALKIGGDLSAPDNGRIHLLTIVPEQLFEEVEAKAVESLQSLHEAMEGERNISEWVVRNEDVEDGITEAALSTDLLVLGASKEGLADRSHFGGLAPRLASASPIPSIIARGREEIEHGSLVRIWELLSDPLPKLTDARRAEVVENMKDAAVPTVDFYVLIILSATIATLGLLQNSAAVIIGAMLVAPLMSPILATAMSMVQGDLPTLVTAGEATIKGAVLAIAVGLIVVIISPIKDPTSEILARTQPNILDLMIALASGAAAGYAMSRKEVAAAMPGVAIAAALVPPLCVVGFGLATGDLAVAAGALLLFVTNLIAIILAAALTYLALGFQPPRAERGELVRGLKITLASLVVIVIVLGITTVITVREANRQKEVQAILSDEAVENALEVRDVNITRRRGETFVDATLLAFKDEQLTPEEITQVQDDINEVLGDDTLLEATVLSAYQVDLEYAADVRTLTIEFEEALAAKSAEYSELDIELTPAGYTFDSTIISHGDELLTEDDLAEIQQRLEEAVAAPVNLQATVLVGQRTQIEGSVQESSS